MGDRIELSLPLSVRRVKCDPRVSANAGRVALQYGPLLYNVESVDLPDGVSIDNLTLPEKSVLRSEWDGKRLGGVMVIRGGFANGVPLLAVPYYARMNRIPVLRDGDAKPGGRTPGVRSVVWLKES